MSIKYQPISINNNINFSNQTVLITGGTRGIGLQIQKDFKKFKANVISLNSAKYDLSKEAELSLLLNYIKKIDKIDILINNAGTNYTQLNKNFTFEKYNELMNVNLKAPFAISKEVSKKMIKNKFGRIINIASIASKRVRIGKSSYSASKFGLVGFTQTLAIELAKYNILVNSVSPGFIDTDMTKTMLSKTQRNQLRQQVPLKKLGTPHDISNIVIFLCSKYNQFITGHNLIVDGGFTGSINV